MRRLMAKCVICRLKLHSWSEARVPVQSHGFPAASGTQRMLGNLPGVFVPSLAQWVPFFRL